MEPFYRLKVGQCIEETTDCMSFHLRLPEHLAEIFSYRPGQFLTLQLEFPQQTLQRCYSLSAAPGSGIRLTVKRVDGGVASNWLLDEVHPGKELRVSPPQGTFHLVSWSNDCLLLAGGSGITPIFSIAQAMLQQGTGRVMLIDINHDTASVIFRDALRQLATDHPGRFTLIHWLTTERGRPCSQQLAELLAPMRHAEAYVCGSSSLMETIRSALDLQGIQPGRQHYERFTAGTARSGTTRGENVHMQVELDGSLHSVEGTMETSLLDAIEKAGLQPPSSCRVGGCGSCRCRVTSGTVSRLAPQMLDSAEEDAGWTLACQARALSPSLHVIFSD